MLEIVGNHFNARGANMTTCLERGLCDISSKAEFRSYLAVWKLCSPSFEDFSFLEPPPNEVGNDDEYTNPNGGRVVSPTSAALVGLFGWEHWLFVGISS